MNISCLDKPTVVGMDAQIVTVTPDNVSACGIPAVQQLLANVVNQKMLEDKPGSVGGFTLCDENGVRNIIFARICNEPTTARIEKIMAKAVAQAAKMNSKKVMVSFSDSLTPELIGKACETMMIASYRFDKYKTVKKEQVQFFVSSDKDYAKEFTLAVRLAEATNLARTLVNEPEDVMTPLALVTAAEKVAKENGMDVSVMNESEIEKLGMHSFLAVGRGGANVPYLVAMRYKGDPKSQDVIGLIGKGLTFDSGGYCVKSGDGMYTMKCDMGGAAAVIGAMQAIAQSGVKANVTAVVAACENMISDAAYRPGEILTSMSGKTVEVVNTDAEGRLTLIDAITYAIRKEGATKLIDIATLTGAAAGVLGKTYLATFADDENLYASLEKASATSTEKIWRLPCDEDFGAMLKSNIADISHMGSEKVAGASVAAMFLKEFTEGKPWAHLDIAGPAYYKSATDMFAAGGSGCGTRLLYHTVMELAK